MFSKLVSRNSRRNRKENGLFFGSLFVSVVAFYMVLSLSGQDVMVFLKKMESDAVDKLLALIPVFYGASLFLLFFLIYYASWFQMERRRHEFGVYLMMGMRRTRLFRMLLTEDLRNSMVTLLTGLPAAVLLAELVSLVTARLVGIGLIGHQVSFSWKAVAWTVAGFLLIKLAAFLMLSGRNRFAAGRCAGSGDKTDAGRRLRAGGHSGYPFSCHCLRQSNQRDCLG